MHHLPDELILHIISYLEPPDLVALQRVSHHLLALARDNALWRQLCFEHSPAERRRRRLLPSLDELDPRLAELVRAANDVAGVLPPPPQTQRTRRAALWDPAFPGEKVDFYAEYVQRHAPHHVSWFQAARRGRGDEGAHHEATGAGVLYGAEGVAEKVVAPLEDGSICLWDAGGRIVARSAMGVLAGKGSDLDYGTRLAQSRAAMTETGAVESVSVDSRAGKAFFAVQNDVAEVDLRTLQVVARTPYPFAVTALSEAAHPMPLTVGTNWTVHLHDTRTPPSLPAASSRCELIAGTPAFSRLDAGPFGGHVSLAQPGALSILHDATAGDIWVAGRFTSLLAFDRRFFPRLRGTVHSGARLSSLTALPAPFSPRASHGTARGTTLVAAGEYKGKGSLELYDAATPTAHYRNRQTAGASKLLSVCAHGTRLVFSDADGTLKWVERDAHTPVRGVNINGDAAAPPEADFVQKILPAVEPRARPVPLAQDTLIVWTGDGRIGQVGFGAPPAGDVRACEEGEGETREREQERRFAGEMRRALEMQAREARWLRGYGL